jgi:uncharacterized membrane protein YhiD involved in acid resistance
MNTTLSVFASRPAMADSTRRSHPYGKLAVDPIGTGTGIDWRAAFQVVSGILFAVFAFVGKRLFERVDHCVTKADLDEILKRQAQDSTQLREDRRAMHEENQTAMRELRQSTDSSFRRIFEKFDENEERNVASRKEVTDSVHQIALQVASLGTRNDRNPNQPRR